jgi:hypothetical protein
MLTKQGIIVTRQIIMLSEVAFSFHFPGIHCRVFPIWSILVGFLGCELSLYSYSANIHYNGIHYTYLVLGIHQIPSCTIIGFLFVFWDIHRCHASGQCLAMHVVVHIPPILVDIAYLRDFSRNFLKRGTIDGKALYKPHKCGITLENHGYWPLDNVPVYAA